MPADIYAENFFFAPKFFICRVFPERGVFILFIPVVDEIKQRHLSFYRTLAVVEYFFDNGFICCHHLTPVQMETVHGTRQNQAFKDFLVCKSIFYRKTSFDKFIKLLEFTVPVSVVDNIVYHRLANTPYCGKAITDICARNGEIRFAQVDVRWKYTDIHLSAREDITRYFIRLVINRGNECCHELRRVIVFEPGGLICDDRITCRVRLVEGIFGKIHHRIIDVVCRFLRYAF